MTADDPRYTLRQAADLTDKSIDTLRRWTKNGSCPAPARTPTTRPAPFTSRPRR
jgi:predicted site-specific integrase-resolvase